MHPNQRRHFLLNIYTADKGILLDSRPYKIVLEKMLSIILLLLRKYYFKKTHLHRVMIITGLDDSVSHLMEVIRKRAKEFIVDLPV